MKWPQVVVLSWVVLAAVVLGVTHVIDAAVVMAILGGVLGAAGGHAMQRRGAAHDGSSKPPSATITTSSLSLGMLLGALGGSWLL